MPNLSVITLWSRRLPRRKFSRSLMHNFDQTRARNADFVISALLPWAVTEREVLAFKEELLLFLTTSPAVPVRHFIRVFLWLDVALPSPNLGSFTPDAWRAAENIESNLSRWQPWWFFAAASDQMIAFKRQLRRRAHATF